SPNRCFRRDNAVPHWPGTATHTYRHTRPDELNRKTAAESEPARVPGHSRHSAESHAPATDSASPRSLQSVPAGQITRGEIANRSTSDTGPRPVRFQKTSDAATESDLPLAVFSQKVHRGSPTANPPGNKFPFAKRCGTRPSALLCDS